MAASQISRAATWALVAHALLASALFVSNGHRKPMGLFLLIAATIAIAYVLAFGARERMRAFPFADALAWTVAFGSVVLGFDRAPGIYLPSTLWPYTVLNGVAAALLLSYLPAIRSGLLPDRVFARIRRVALFGIAFAMGAWLLRESPAPNIDVWSVHQQGAEVLLSGRTPYAAGVIRTIDTASHARDILVYPYPPLSLLLTTVAYALTGESRWAALVAILVGAGFLYAVARRATASTSAWPDLLAACLLFHPRGLFVLEQAWGDPLALIFLGAFTMFALDRKRALMAVALGLACAIKQQFLLYLAVLAFVPALGAQGAAIAFAITAATYVPFFALSPGEMWSAIVVHHWENPFREDSLSASAALAHVGIRLSSWVGMVSALASLSILRWIPRTLGHLLLASAFTFLMFYIFGRQAFCNYYYLVDGTVLFAAAALAPCAD